MYFKSPKFFQRVLAGLLACLHWGITPAQSASPNNVLQTNKTVELTYQSPFQHYQPYAASDIQAWKQANDTVKDVGGWREYAKEITKHQDAQPFKDLPAHGDH